jgi:lysophospholipase L1-like esterase
MKTILCYGDSNTWGYNPANGGRIPYHKRWTGLLQNKIGPEFKVIEEGLNGRTTVWDDPLHGGYKNGRNYLIPCLASHRPLDIVILFLGTNDLKMRFSLSASEITSGIRVLVDDISKSNAGRNEKAPKICLVAPPIISNIPDSSRFSEEYENSTEKSRKIGDYFNEVAQEYQCDFLDASKVVRVSKTDGIHLDEEGHLELGNALTKKVENILK